MMENQYNNENLTNILKNLKETYEILKTNPYYTPIVKKFINSLEEDGDYTWPASSIKKQLSQFVSNIWYSISSAASITISADQQKEIMLELRSDLKKLHRELSSKKPNYLILFYKKIDFLENKWKKYLKNLDRNYISKEELQKKSFFKLDSNLPKWKQNLLELIAENNLFLKSDSPRYLLKSGIKSFYFFNNTYAVFDRDIRKDYVKLVIEGINQKINELKRENENVNLIIWLSKTYGEGDSTVLFGSQQIDLPYCDLLMLPHVNWYDIARGLILEKDLPYQKPILIDDLTGTGGTLKEALERLGDLKLTPIAYIGIVDRSLVGLENTELSKKIRIFSLVNRRDLLYAGIWEPEILLANMNTLEWTSLDLTTDTIKEAIIYYGKKESYTTLKKKFDDLILNKIYIFDDDFIISDKELIINIIENIIIISYNTIKDVYPIIKNDAGLEYLEIILEEECEHFYVIDLINKTLYEAINVNNVKNLSLNSFIKIISFNVGKKISENISRLKEQLNKRGVEMNKPRITDRELQEDVEKRINRVKKIDSKYIALGYMDKQPEEFYVELKSSFYQRAKLQYDVIEKK